MPQDPEDLPRPKTGLIKQPHGGAIAPGAHSGPHPGRPPMAVREALRESGFARIHILEHIADDEEMEPHERLAAISIMLDHGLRGNISIDDVRDAVKRTLAVIQEHAPHDVAMNLIRLIRPIWRTGPNS